MTPLKSRLRAMIFLIGFLAICDAAWAAERPELIDVGGFRLDVLRGGSGGPPIIFEAGLGSTLETWEKVWPAAAKLSTTVAYSRFGLGRSDAGSSDHRASSRVAELHALLMKLGLKPPYVLVGKSYGGILVRLYTSTHPAEVGGLVIVEGSHEQQVQRWGKLDATYPAAFRDFFGSRLRKLNAGAEADEIRETMRIQAAGGVEGMKPLPDIPIAVLTSMKVDAAPQTVNQTEQGRVAWRAMHDEWFNRSRDGIHLVTTRSGHGMEEEEPELVVQGISFVLARLKR